MASPSLRIRSNSAFYLFRAEGQFGISVHNPLVEDGAVFQETALRAISSLLSDKALFHPSFQEIHEITHQDIGKEKDGSRR